MTFQTASPVAASDITLEARDGRFGVHVCEPAGREPSAGIVLLHEIFGITERIRRYAADYAAAGLRVVVPDLFWREAPGVVLGHDGPDMKLAMARLKRLDEAATLGDLAACADWLRQRGAGLPVAMIGYCLGGKLVVEARMAGLADAYVAYYGIGVEHVAGDLAQVDAPLVMHYGTADPYAPAEVVRGFAVRLGTRAALHFYEGAGHAFYRPGRDAASTLSRERTLAFLTDSAAPRST